MRHTAIILGAGASAPAGGPLMGNFLSKAAERYEHGGGDWELLCHARKCIRQADTEQLLDMSNVEVIRGELEAVLACERELAGMSAQQCENALKALKRVIVRTIEETIEFPARSESGQYLLSAPSGYKELAALIKQGYDGQSRSRISLLTMNYDLAIDLTLQVNAVPVKYEIADSHSPSAVPLLKLHGSLHWVRDESTGQLSYVKDIHGHRPSWGEPLQSIRLQMRRPLNHLLNRKLDQEVEPFIVPPARSKTGHLAELQSVWNAAKGHLSDAAQIVIIGYSLPSTDAHFQQTFKEALAANYSLEQIVVIDPSEQVAQRWRDALVGRTKEKLYHCNYGFSTGGAQMILNGLLQRSARD